MNTQIIRVNSGATVNCFSESYPATVIEIIASNKVKIQYDEIIKYDKNNQGVEFMRNENGLIQTCYKTKKGWKIIGESSTIDFGERYSYTNMSL